MSASIDTDLLVLFNSSGNPWLDSFMTTCTSTLTWIPLFLSLIIMLHHSARSCKDTLLIVCGAIMCVLVADIVAEGMVKPLVGRLRPCNNPALSGTLTIVNGYRSDDFSFFSGHASNTFSLTIYLIYVVRKRWFAIMMATWSLLNCYTRLYLAQHYPSDIVVGLVWGSIVGLVSYKTVEPRLHRSEYHTFLPTIAMAVCLLYAGMKATLHL